MWACLKAVCVTILFNLLPWREARRRECKRIFVRMLVLSALLGVVIVLGIGIVNARQLSDQRDRNNLLRSENAVLDARIREISNLRRDIEALKARQAAVETLQHNRNQPVYLMDELASLVPAGIALKSLRQTDIILLNGYAQSNARVSELLRNFDGKSHWLAQPELVEIKSASVGQGREARKLFEFTMSVRYQSGMTAGPQSEVSPLTDPALAKGKR